MAEAVASSNNEETTIEVIREELRHVVVEERKSHRGDALNKKRSALGEIQDKKRNWDSNIVARKAKLLKKKVLPMEDYLCLQSALIQDEANINSFLSIGNVLTALVRDLSGINPALQLAAANCCCNIALANSKACISVAKTAGPYLVGQLDTLNYPLVEVCAWTIGNLASGSESAFQALCAQGCLKRLFSLLRDCEPSILPSIMYAVKHCLYGGHEIIPDSEMVELTKILIHRSWTTESETLWLLALLSSREACAELLYPILPTIFDLLYNTVESKTSNVDLLTAAIRLLGNTVSEPTGSAAKALFHNTDEKLKILLENLLSHPQNHVRKETCWLVGNLYCHSLPEISQRTLKFITLLPSLHRAASLSQDLDRPIDHETLRADRAGEFVQ